MLLLSGNQPVYVLAEFLSLDGNAFNVRSRLSPSVEVASVRYWRGKTEVFPIGTISIFAMYPSLENVVNDAQWYTKTIDLVEVSGGKSSISSSYAPAYLSVDGRTYWTWRR